MFNFLSFVPLIFLLECLTCFKRNYKIELRGNAECYFRWVADRIYRVNIRKLKKFIILYKFLCCKVARAFIWFVTWERLVMFAILCESYLHTKWCTVLDLNLLSDCMGHNLQISCIILAIQLYVSLGWWWPFSPHSFTIPWFDLPSPN